MDFTDKIPPTGTAGVILQQFYKESDLPPDGGISSPRAQLKFTQNISIYIPNIDARRKALLKHDVHHLLTGYNTFFKGETEISAWEIGSRCRKYWAAWFLDLQGLMLGIWLYPVAVYHAFMRGRHSDNLYADAIEDEKLKNMTVPEIANIIKIPAQTEQIKADVNDIFSFLWNLFIGGFFSIAVLLIYLPFLLLYNAVVFVKLKTTSA